MTKGCDNIVEANSDKLIDILCESCYTQMNKKISRKKDTLKQTSLFSIDKKNV